MPESKVFKKRVDKRNTIYIPRGVARACGIRGGVSGEDFR